MKTNEVSFAKNINKLLVCLGLSVACFTAASSAYAAVAGRVQFVNGEVQITDPAGQTRMAQKGDAISEGDTLTSAQKSSAQIKMQDGGYIAVRPDTRLKFDQFVFAGKEDGSEKSFFSLFKGGFRAVTGLIGRINKQNYKITTPAATIGIRGTDHETVVIAPNGTAMPPGTYNMVNVGATSMTTNVGTVNVQPGAGMAYSPGMNQPPAIMPLNTSLFTASPPPAEPAPQTEGQSSQQDQDSQQADGQAEGGTQAAGGGGDSASGETAAEDTSIRETAVVDAAPPATGSAPAASTSTSAAAGTATEVIVSPANTNTVLTTATAAGGTTVDITSGTATTGTGQIIPVIDSVAAAQAQAAADAALAAANAAQAAAAATATADSALAAVALVPTTPATTAIGTASAGITSADVAVAAATALTPANPTTAASNAATSQATASAAAAQAAAAQASLTANGAFADSTAGPANTTVQSASSAAQSANTAVQTAAGAVPAQNAALATAQGAATTALTAANANLTTADNNLIAANTQNAAITAAQGAVPAQVTAAQTAAANAQTAAVAAQLAADEAAIFQAAGDLAGAQAQLLIAQQELAFAQQQLALAQAAQTAVTSQLAAAQTAQTAASTAVTTAEQAAILAADAAATASAEAAAAQTAASTAASALVQTDPAPVSAQAAIVAANAPVATYNNPAVATPDRFIGMIGTVKADTGGGYIEGYGPGAELTTGTANTSFVLDGAGNLVESRHAWYEETPASSATPQLVVVDANIKRTGGVAAETFKMPDNSIYAGRWVGGTITVSDNNATPIPTFARDLGVTSEHWAILLAPPVDYVQTLNGTVTYNKVAATSPTDALGNAGTLNTASLTANFTSQLVDATLNLTIAGKTLDVLASSMVITGAHFSTSTQPVTAGCTGCAGTYYANVGGGFAGDMAATAGLNYTLWTGVAPGATTGAADLIQGMAAFSAATTPSSAVINPAAGLWSAWAQPTVGTTAAYQRGVLSTATPIANTNFVLDGTGNLVKALHAGYREQATWSISPATSVYTDATITFSGGTPNDYYMLPDGSRAIGRWTGGTMTIADNLAVLPTIVKPLGLSSAPWTMGQPTPDAYIQTLVGTTTYTMRGATLPTDSFGNVGTAPTATLVANFTNMTVDASVAFTIASQGLSVTATQMPIATNAVNQGTANGFFARSEDGNAPVISCTGAGCSGSGYLGRVIGGFDGAVAASAEFDYTVWPTAAAGSTVSDIIQGIVVFDTTTAPSAGTNPAAGLWDSFSHLPVGSTGAWERGRFNMSTVGGSLPETNFILDGNGNLVSSLHVNYNERPTWNLSGGPVSYADAAVSYSGGTASDLYTLPDGSLTIGRWTGGQLIVVDNLGSLPNLTKDLGLTSAYWGLRSGLTPGYVQALVGTTTYTQMGATLPTDTFGNVGTVPVATLTANFTSQTVDASVAFTIASQSLSASAANVPISVNTFDATLELGNAPAVTCTGGGCSGGGYLGWLTGNFAGPAAAGADIQYKIWPTATQGSLVSDIIQGIVAFSADTAPVVSPPEPYVATGTSVAYTGAYGGAFNFVAGTGDLNSTTSPTYFRETYGDGSGFKSDTLFGASGLVGPTTVNTANNATPIVYGNWGTVSSVTSSWQYQLWPGNSLPGYMYGAQGYLDAAYWNGASVTGAMANTFSYTSMAATSIQSDTWATGNVLTATMSANFTAQTVNVALAGTMGASTWGLSSTAMPINFGGTMNFSDSAAATTLNGSPCPTCVGNIEGAFIGQNFAGAIVRYGFYDEAAIQGMNANGMVAFAQNAPVTPGTPAPTGMTVILNQGSLSYSDNPVTTDGAGVLTGWGGTGWGTTVTPAAGSAALTPIVTGSSTIYWGIWGEGTTVAGSFNYTPGTTQIHWITAPEPTPIYLAEVLTATNAVYNFISGNATNMTGTAYSSMSGSLSANFTMQTVAVNLALVLNGHNWSAITSSAPLHYLNNNSLTGFYADSWAPSGTPGSLTVTVDGAAAHGSLVGQLVGAALDGAFVKFNLDGQVGASYEFVQGVAAFQAAAVNDPATSYRIVATAYSDPAALVPVAIVGGSYNNSGRVIAGAYGPMVQFDDNSGNNKGGGVTISAPDAPGTFAEQGSATIAGAPVSWGRWAPGTMVTVADRATGATQNVTLTSGAHAVLGPIMTGPVALPTTGVYGYTLVGNTTPTTDTGAVGTLNNVSLQANFTTQTVDVGVNVTAASATLNAVAANVPIQNRAMFYTDSRMTGPGALAVTCSGTCGTTNHGAIGGGFGGPGGAAAAITYGFEKSGVNAGTVSGVAVFQQGAQIPQ
jgi:hypothetical protein